MGKPRRDLEDGYEPVGKALNTMGSWVNKQGRDFDTLCKDKDVRNIESKGQINEKPLQEVDHMVLITENGKLIYKETFVEDIVNYNDHLSDDNVLHLQRNLSETSIKPAEILKDGLSKKELKKKKAEEEKLIKDENKRIKLQKDAVLKEEKQKEKLRKKEEKLAKEKETKLQKEQEKIQQRQENDESQEDTSNSKTANKSKSIIDTMIDKVRKLSTDEKDPAVSKREKNE